MEEFENQDLVEGKGQGWSMDKNTSAMAHKALGHKNGFHIASHEHLHAFGDEAGSGTKILDSKTGKVHSLHDEDSFEGERPKPEHIKSKTVDLPEPFKKKIASNYMLDDHHVNEETVSEIDEETKAAASLHPAAAPGESKAQTLATFTQLLSQLGKEDLSKFFNQMQDQFGSNKVPGAKDNSSSNKASINAKPSAAKGSGGAAAAEPMPKLSVKEDVQEMFSGEDLTEEFMEKAEVVFEAAVNTRVAIERVALEEEFEAKTSELEEEFNTKLEESVEELTNKLDQYLDYCVEQFMEENKLAVETSLRADIAESFITGLHNLFSEHYITVPEEKMDLVAELKAELDETKSKLSEAVDESLELKATIAESSKNAIFDEVSEGLVETQVEKLRTLSESVEFSDTETYKKKLSIIKENYFNKKPAGNSTGLIVEEIDGDLGEDQKPGYTAPGMNRYVEAISKTVK